MGEIRRIYCGPETAVLGHHPWNSLTEPSAINLMNHATVKDLTRGDTVDADFGIVTSGVLAVERMLSDGRRTLCALFHEGDLVDLRRTMRDNQGRLVALNPSRLLALNEQWISNCAAPHPDIALAFVIQLRDYLARMRDHAMDLVSKTPLEKLASVLFEFRHWPETMPEEGHHNMVRIPIQRTDIADYIGVKPETVSRALRQLERESLIDIPQHDRIFLNDIPSMRRIANGGRPRRSTRPA